MKAFVIFLFLSLIVVNIGECATGNYTLVADQIVPLYTADPRISTGDPNLLRSATCNVLDFQGSPGCKAQDYFSTADRLDYFEKVMTMFCAELPGSMTIGPSVQVIGLADILMIETLLQDFDLCSHQQRALTDESETTSLSDRGEERRNDHKKNR
ncbi:MAG: hypothetical protein KKG09_02085 [Verrucomicrobia bacterium]|nr:hypothetical protein [Verrucomicrobiota bacterium]MCG2681418.1 hypothetical protein [Kiritimatiellia bacterium]MBU4248318.1 hypothetical protein [Verrucomicrobiota bacterium]MBU4289845.1 hypothetical protein [Verrucomicrobiota bacterium]MBU4430316.1 hypothetical protein [Verrucomicrobiota bacterium]